jgi:hypothetical protein
LHGGRGGLARQLRDQRHLVGAHLVRRQRHQRPGGRAQRRGRTARLLQQPPLVAAQPLKAIVAPWNNSK